MSAVLHVAWPQHDSAEPNGHGPDGVCVYKRESVLYDPNLVDYQIDLIQCGTDGVRHLLGRVHARLHDIRIGYRLTIEGMVPGMGSRPMPSGKREPTRRMFYDNFGEPFATREEAGHRYHEQMQIALEWLRVQGGVEDLEHVPALK